MSKHTKGPWSRVANSIKSRKADGTKHIMAEYLYQGEWQTAIEEELTSPTE